MIPTLSFLIFGKIGAFFILHQATESVNVDMRKFIPTTEFSHLEM
jgi:hypothetical protein